MKLSILAMTTFGWSLAAEIQISGTSNTDPAKINLVGTDSSIYDANIWSGGGGQFPSAAADGAGHGVVVQSHKNGHIMLELRNNNGGDAVHIGARSDNNPDSPADFQAHYFRANGDAMHKGNLQVNEIYHSKGIFPNAGGFVNSEWSYRQRNRGGSVLHKILGPDLVTPILNHAGYSNSFLEITVVCTGTGTSNMYTQYHVVTNSDRSSITLTHKAGNSGSSSNRPYMQLDGDHPAWIMAHTSAYIVRIHVKQYGGDSSYWSRTPYVA